MKPFKETLKQAGRGIAIAAAMVAIGITGIAAADPIAFIPSGADIQIKFQNREVEINPNEFGFGQELFGIVNITQILNIDGTQTYWNGNGSSDGMQLVGYFEGLLSEPDQTGGGGLSFSGGKVVLYLVPNGDYKPATNPNTKDYASQLCGGACPAPWLTADFVPGINDSIGGDATLQAAIASTNVQAGFGYLSVTGGANAAFFDTNGFTFTNFGPADMFLRSNFVLSGGQSCSTAQSSGWQVCSDDPIIGRAVPEPATLALLGLGMLAAGVVRIRKRLI
ncbi:MAG TPA: PEP-CTERM sorting domain-containing protein [Casimicrobiaceae bacterium]